MKITTTIPQAQKNLRAASLKPAQAPQQEAAENLPTDTFTMSAGTIAGREKFQVATITVAVGLLGAVPGLGIATSVLAAGRNEVAGDELGGWIGIAGAVTNVVASAAALNGGIGVWSLAVPAVLGAASWGGYAAIRAAAD